MTKFTAIPTILYRKLISQNSGYDDALDDRKSKILTGNLPTELKARFYQDVIRNIVKRKEEEEKRPVFVKGYDTTESDSKLIESPKNKEIETLESGVTKTLKNIRKKRKQAFKRKVLTKKNSVFNADNAKKLNPDAENYYDAFEEFAVPRAETPQTNQMKRRRKYRESIQTRSYTKKKQPPQWIEID